MPGKAEKQARMQMMHELEELQTELSTQWLDKSLPDDWTGMDWHAPVDRHSTRVTIRLDSDMLRWFRRLGPGYQKRINRVLRIYWMALLSGHIRAFPEDNTVPRLVGSARRVREELAKQRGGTVE